MTITVFENLRITVPITVIMIAKNKASIAMIVDVSKVNTIQFKIILNDTPMKFRKYIEFWMGDLTNSAVILCHDENGI